MTVYRRYFRITEGPLVEEYKKTEKINDKAHKEYSEILKEIGAEQRYYHQNFMLTCMLFSVYPDTKIYKRKDSGWYPKKNCRQGKEIAKRIESVETKNPDSCLEGIGLSYNSPEVFSGAKCYYNTLIVIPENKPVFYVSVPFNNEDKKDITWEPSDEMQEVKKWEVEKHIEEWNDKVKNKAQGE
jgi:hypothetical protein